MKQVCSTKIAMCLKIQVLGNGSLSTVSICIEKVSGKRFALKAGGVASVDLDFRKVQQLQFLPFWGMIAEMRTSSVFKIHYISRWVQ